MENNNLDTTHKGDLSGGQKDLPDGLYIENNGKTVFIEGDRITFHFIKGDDRSMVDFPISSLKMALKDFANEWSVSFECIDTTLRTEYQQPYKQTA